MGYLKWLVAKARREWRYFVCLHRRRTVMACGLYKCWDCGKEPM